MNSRESTYYRKPQYKDRDTRQDDYYDDDRWEERQGNDDHDTPRDNFRSYGGEVQSSMERSGGDGEYSDNPRRVYIEKSLNSDQSRRSPLKRHSLGGFSPEKYMDREYPRFEERDEEFVRKQRQLQMIEEEIARKKSAIKFLSSETERISEKKRRRFTEDVDDFKYGQSPDDSEYRQSSDHMYREKDFPCRQPPRDDLSYQKTSRDSKHGNQPEDFTYNQTSDDSTYIKSPAHYKDRHFQDCSNDEDTQSDQFFSRVDATPRERSPERDPSSDYEDHRQNSLRYERNASYEQVDATPRERDYSPSSDYDDHRRNSLRYERNTSYEQLLEEELDVTGQGPGQRPHNAAAKGFERFLGLLNKGVNVDKLIKIVGQSPAVADDPTSPQTPRLNAEKPLWSDRTTSQQERQSNKPGWSESQGSPSEVPQKDQKGRGSEQPRPKTSYRSFQKGSQSDERESMNKSSVEGNPVSSRAKSPRLVEKMLARPVDEQKSRQMRDLLQVIGMDLGFEELGQMSSRIQERLYGKKDDFEKKDSDLRRERRVSSRHHSRSLSSSRSSFGPFTQNVSEIPKDIKEVKQHTFNDESSKIHVQDNDKYGNNKSQNCSVAFQSFSHSPSYSVSKPPPPTPVIPAYHSTSKPPPTPAYPPPPFWPNTYSTAPAPPFPPNWGIRFGMMPPVPFVPGYPPYPSAPTLNTYQAPSSQVNTLFQPTIHRQLINLSSPTQNQSPVQHFNTIQKSKTLQRPRCLQFVAEATDAEKASHRNVQ